MRYVMRLLALTGEAFLAGSGSAHYHTVSQQEGSMKIISAEDAPAPGGHYSQAVIHGDTLYTAGLLPVEAGTGEKVLGSVEEQAECVLANLGAILAAAGAGREDVVRCTVYVSDLGDWGAINEVYARFFGAHRPARTVVPTPGLHYGFALELEAIAAVG